MKRVVWKEGDLVSLKLKDDLYTLHKCVVALTCVFLI